MDSAILLLVCFLLVVSSAAGGAAWYFFLRPKKLTKADVDAHNKAGGTWIPYKGVVYDVAPLIDQVVARSPDTPRQDAAAAVGLGFLLGSPTPEALALAKKVGDFVEA